MTLSKKDFQAIIRFSLGIVVFVESKDKPLTYSAYCLMIKLSELRYFKKNLLKVELGVCRGKKNYDKRQTIKERDIKRNIEKQMK